MNTFKHPQEEQQFSAIRTEPPQEGPVRLKSGITVIEKPCQPSSTSFTLGDREAIPPQTIESA